MISTSSIPRWKCLLVAALLLALYLGVGVFDHDIWAPTEPAVAGVVWNMFQNGDWAIPRIHEFPYLEKPPLNYWISTLFCQIVGRLDAGWIRLPSALYGLLCLLGTAWALESRIRPETSLVLLPLLATSGFFYELFHRAGSDALATAFGFACWAVFLRTLSPNPPEPRKTFALDVLFSILLAASFYAKNFSTCFVVLPPVLLFLLAKRQFRRAFNIGLLVSAFSILLILPWALALHEKGGWDYLRVVFVDNTLGRFLDLGDQRTMEILNDAYVVEKNKSLFFYAESLASFMLPWIFFYFVAIASLFRRGGKQDDFRLFLKISLVSVPLVLTLSSSRSVFYAAPILLILFLIAGEFLSEWLDTPRPLHRWERWLLQLNTLFVSLALAVAPFALALYFHRLPMVLWSIPFVLVLAWLFCTHRFHPAAFSFGFLNFSAIAMILLLACAYPALNEMKSFRFFFEDIQTELDGREIATVFCDDRRLPVLTYYLHRRMPLIQEQDIRRAARSHRPLGLILPPDLYEKHLPDLQPLNPTVIQAQRGKEDAFVFVGLTPAITYNYK